MERMTFGIVALGLLLPLQPGCSDGPGSLPSLVFAADASTSDAGEASADASSRSTPCPGTQPTTVFTTSDLLDKLTLLDGTLYAEVSPSSTASMLAGGVVRCPTSGCSSPQLVASAPDTAAWGDEAIGTSNVYYSLVGTLALDGDGGSAPNVDGAIDLVALDGSGATAFAPQLAYPTFLATANGQIFWVNDPQAAGDIGTSTVFACPQSSGCAAGDGAGLAGAPWITGIGTSYALFADEANVYVLSDQTVDSASGVANLYSCPLSAPCTAPVLVESNVDTSGSFSFAANGAYLFASEQDKPTVVRIDLAQRATTTILADDQDDPTGLAVDADYVYWGSADGKLVRTRSDGSAGVETVGCGLSSPDHLVLDATFVYFIAGNGSGSAVLRLPKPL